VVTEVLFTVAVGDDRPLNWRAFVEPQTGAVLYLRAFVDHVRGLVYRTDPNDQTGDTTNTPADGAATLNTFSTSETLEGLTSPTGGDPQALSGEFVVVEDFDAPTDPPPTEPPGDDFDYGARTRDFAAVNAYYHVDRMFRMVEDMGFDIGVYFDDTTFPVPVDHWGLGGVVNARCAGNTAGDGVGWFSFGRCVSGQPVGIATEARTVMHEFGHALLHDSIHAANFGFAHSPGDSLAVILNDPESDLTGPERFVVFNWCPLREDRRCDREASDGWGWGGIEDVGDYPSEEILASTMFRIYQSAWGDYVDSRPEVQRAVRRAAARYVVYLMLRAISSLATSPITPTNTPNVFATALMSADIGTWDFEGHRGGALWKVIRWSFEKQGLYQPPGTTGYVDEEGAPPPVDVYIDDGRHGEYEFQRVFWETTDIWNRHRRDGGTEHRTPWLGVSNYAYVRVKNRGSEPATEVVVRGYHTRPSAGIVWPDDWQPMVTTELSPSGHTIPAGEEAIVGPFEWVPNNEGHECLLMYVSANGDLSNIDPVTALPCAAGPIPDSRLTPFDNNIGQRNVAPVPGAGGREALLQAFAPYIFLINNPFPYSARVEIRAALPEFLAKRKWAVWYEHPDDPVFKLGPRGSEKVAVRLKAGADFTYKDVPPDAAIRILALVNNQLVGGMTYAIDPKLEVRPEEYPDKRERPD
jgi:hypothetical protein